MPARVLQQPSASTIDTLTNENSIHQFSDSNFDAIAFLNDAIPPLDLLSSFRTDQVRSKVSSSQEASTQTQAFLSRVNAQNIRFSSTLSQLTDEILRSGGRLAYEVEILRGDANALRESLGDTLREDIQKFTSVSTSESKNSNMEGDQAKESSNGQDPEFVDQLRMLEQVKARLDSVINVFGEAMKWPIPPSELSLTSALISVSGPEPGSENDSLEERGKDFAKKARAEIVELLDNATDGAGVEAAEETVESLRLLSTVWKGTAEERARTKFVDSLKKLIDDKKKQIEIRSLSQPVKAVPGAGPQSSSAQGRPAPGLARERPTNESGAGGGGGGLLRNLQRLRDEIYLD